MKKITLLIVSILTLSAYARLLKWENWQANQPANIKTKFWMFMLIVVLSAVFVGLNHRIYKLIRKK
jgi:hypothetical protein